MRRISLALIFAFVVGAGLGLGRALAPAAPYLLHVPVQDAAGLYPGSDVMIAGAGVGRVESIDLSGAGALVTFSVDGAHSPLHAGTTVAVRPKSLLGERYLAIADGQGSAELASGASLPATAITQATDLEDVVNTFDAPTRERLQTLIVELGDGVAGRGQELNAGLAAGRADLSDLRGIAATLAQRDSELRSVITNLDSVTQELARSDRRQELGQLIQGLEALLSNLVGQEAQLQKALTASDAALGRVEVGLDGTGGNLADIANELPTTVRLADLVMIDLGTDSTALLPHLAQMNTAIGAGPSVFGGRDASGYATRISLVVGCSSAAACPNLGGGNSAINFLLGRTTP